MTLGLKFFCCNKMAITRRRSNIFPKFRKIPAALDEYYTMAVSNRDFKSFWDIFSKKCMRPWLRRLPILPQAGDLAWRNLAQYQHRSALHAPYFAYAEIWYLPMFLAYQCASRAYKRVVFEVFSFCIYFFLFTFLYFWGRRHEAKPLNFCIIYIFCIFGPAHAAGNCSHN